MMSYINRYLDTYREKHNDILNKGKTMKIKKKSGKEEEFSEKKALNSIIHAGANKKTAESILMDFKPHQGMTTLDVRNKVITSLAKQEPQIAKKFKTFKNLNP